MEYAGSGDGGRRRALLAVLVAGFKKEHESLSKVRDQHRGIVVLLK